MIGLIVARIGSLPLPRFYLGELDHLSISSCSSKSIHSSRDFEYLLLLQASFCSGRVQKIFWISGWMFNNMKTFVGLTSKTFASQVVPSKMTGQTTGTTHDDEDPFMVRLLVWMEGRRKRVPRVQ